MKTDKQGDRGKETIQLHHANTLEFDKRLGDGAKRLIGNVELEDDSVLMNCDSAYVYTDNSFRAFGHVHMSRKDTMDLYGDSVHYSGDNKKAEMFGAIRYLHKAMTLTTHHLLYDLNATTVNYWDGGTLVDSANTLVSRLGSYNSSERMSSFKDNVVLTNPKYIMKCDTMDYAPDEQIAYFRSPTRITSKSNFMYCVAGYYNTHTGVSQFWNNAYIIGKKGTRLSGREIYYNRKKDFGQILDNVVLSDSADKINIMGDYAQYNGMDKNIMVTCHALMDQMFEKDTLHLHGDTLFGYNISMSDTEGSSSPKLLLAYHHVKFFKKDMQGKCDSLSYDEKDSIMRMFHLPIVWSQANQLTADTMYLHLKNKQLSLLDMLQNSFIASKDTAASKDDSLQFNQIKGRNMKGFFVDNKIYKVNVTGNAQTIYYAYSDNNTTVIGANRADCSSMQVFISNNKVKSITYLQKPDATLYPMKDVKPSEFLLGNFYWHEDERPKTKEDIFKD
ncbi:MAG TPA: OstA-like protein [Bacteroidia bacterium]|nr:OstA-like protein [Bacteroidia bacterium]